MCYVSEWSQHLSTSQGHWEAEGETLVEHLTAPDLGDVLSDSDCCRCHFMAEGIPRGHGRWGSPGEMEVEKGMYSKLGEHSRSPERSVMGHFLSEDSEVPGEGEGHHPGWPWWPWVALGGWQWDGRGSTPAPTDQGPDSSPLPL